MAHVARRGAVADETVLRRRHEQRRGPFPLRIAELKRLDKEIERQHKEVAKLDGKLSNKAFTERAPADIVEAEKHKKEQAETALATLARQRNQIEELRSA